MKEQFIYRISERSANHFGTALVKFSIPICGTNANVLDECLKEAKAGSSSGFTLDKVEAALDAFEQKTGVHGEFAEDDIAGEFIF